MTTRKLTEALAALPTYGLAVMEGTQSVEPFDRMVAQLREHFRLLLTR